MSALARLWTVLSRHDRIAVAVSGGVDSMTIEHFQDGMPKIGDSGDDAAEASAAASSAPRILWRVQGVTQRQHC